jgi:hypothetical protein
MKKLSGLIILLALVAIAIGAGLGFYFADRTENTSGITEATTKESLSQDNMADDAAQLAATKQLLHMSDVVGSAILDPVDEEVEENTPAHYELDPLAIESLRAARTQGDARAPALSASAARVLPTVEELEDHDAYAAYEERQSKEVYRAYIRSAGQKAEFLREMIALARKDGLPEEQVREGEEKLRRIESMRQELLTQHPDLLAAEPEARQEFEPASGE